MQPNRTPSTLVPAVQSTNSSRGCYSCGQQGHIRSECKITLNKKLSKAYTERNFYRTELNFFKDLISKLIEEKKQLEENYNQNKKHLKSVLQESLNLQHQLINEIFQLKLKFIHSPDITQATPLHGIPTCAEPLSAVGKVKATTIMRDEVNVERNPSNSVQPFQSPTVPQAATCGISQAKLDTTERFVTNGRMETTTQLSGADVLGRVDSTVRPVTDLRSVQSTASKKKISQQVDEKQRRKKMVPGKENENKTAPKKEEKDRRVEREEEISTTNQMKIPTLLSQMTCWREDLGKQREMIELTRRALEKFRLKINTAQSPLGENDLGKVEKENEKSEDETRDLRVRTKESTEEKTEARKEEETNAQSSGAVQHRGQGQNTKITRELVQDPGKSQANRLGHTDTNFPPQSKTTEKRPRRRRKQKNTRKDFWHYVKENPLLYPDSD